MSSPPPRPAAQPARTPLRLLGLVLAVLVILFAIAWIALAVAFPPAKVRALVQTQLERTLDRQVRFEGASLSLWPPVRLTVTAPALAEPGGFGAGAAFRARAIHLDLDPLALLVRQLVVRRLELIEPFAHLALRADGGTNFDGIAAGPARRAPGAGGEAAAAPFDLVVREFRIRDGRVQVDDARARKRIVFGLDTRLGFRAEQGGARIGTEGEWRISGLAFGPDTATRVTSLDRKLATLEWRIAHAGRFDAANRRLTLDRLALGFGRTALALSGTVDDPGPRAVFDLKARGERVDLGEVVGFLAAGGLPALRGARGGGTARFDLAVAGGGGGGRAPGITGTMVVEGVSIESPALPKKVDSVNGTLAFSPARATLQGLTAHAGQSSFKLDGSAIRPLALLAPAGRVPPAELRFALTSPHLDLRELLPPGPSSPAHFNASGGGQVAIDRLLNDKLDVRNVRATVTLAPDQVVVPSFTFDGYGGAVKGSAKFGMADPARPSFAVKGHADSVRAGQFLAAWTKAAGLLDGSMDADFDLSGAGAQPQQVLGSLTAVGLAAITRGQLGGPALAAIAKATGIERLKEVRFQDMHLPFRVERGRVVTDPVRIAGTDGDWRLTGAIGFDGSLDYAVSLTLPAEVTAKSGAAGALGALGLTDNQGRTLIDLNLGGSLRAPRVSLDERAMRARLAGRASELLDAQRAKLARDLLERAGGGGGTAPADSGGKDQKVTDKELRQKASDLLEGLFGRKRRSAPADSTARDSAGR
jgi:hypothetical protein